jgi:hypothetical protein
MCFCSAEQDAAFALHSAKGTGQGAALSGIERRRMLCLALQIASGDGRSSPRSKRKALTFLSETTPFVAMVPSQSAASAHRKRSDDGRCHYQFCRRQIDGLAYPPCNRIGVEY